MKLRFFQRLYGRERVFDEMVLALLVRECMKWFAELGASLTEAQSSLDAHFHHLYSILVFIDRPTRAFGQSCALPKYQGHLQSSDPALI